MNIHLGMKRGNKELLKEFLLVLPLQALREETRNLQVNWRSCKIVQIAWVCRDVLQVFSSCSPAQAVLPAGHMVCYPGSAELGLMQLPVRILRLYFFWDSLETMPSKWTRDYLNSTKTQATKKEAPTIAESTREHP